MSRFNNGWVKFHRQAVNGDIGRNANLLAIWVTLLCWANRFNTKIIGANGPRDIPPGSLAIGMQELADQLNISKKTIYKWLHYLEKRGSISIEGGTRGTVVTICNWEDYQDSDDRGVTQGEHRGNTEVTQGEHGATLIGEVKNRRSKEEAVVERNRSPLGPILELNTHPLITAALQTVTQKTQQTWLAAYPNPEWMNQEILKAIAWLEVNPKKKAKNFGRFMGSWLARSWETFRKTLPSQSANGLARLTLTEEQLFERGFKFRDDPNDLAAIKRKLEAAQ